MKRDCNYYDKFLERGNRKTQRWVPNRGYCIQEKLQIRCNV